MLRLLFIGACLTSVFFSPVAGAEHQILLKNGQQLVGEVQLPALKLKTGVGAMEVPLNEITSIQGSNITLGDGTSLKGSIVDKSIAVQTRYGVVNIKTQDIKEMSLTRQPSAQVTQQAYSASQAPASKQNAAELQSAPSEKEAGAQRQQGSFMSPTKATSKIGQTVAQNQAELADGPKKRVAIKRFDNKTSYNSQGQGNIGNGMLEMLTTAMVNTNRFIVLERQDMNDVMEEQNFGASGRVKGKTAAKIGEVEGAELLIYGTVTDYMADQSGAQAGVGQNSGMQIGSMFGSLGMAVGAIVGGVAGSASAQKAHVAIDLRIVDAHTGRVVSATSIEGSPKDIGGSIQIGPFGGSAATKTPIGMAIRDCIYNAVNWILITSFPAEKEKFLAIAAADTAALQAQQQQAGNANKQNSGGQPNSAQNDGSPPPRKRIPGFDDQ